MNQDFGLSLTPANARRLLMFQEVSTNIVLPDAVRQMAEQDMITERNFDTFVCPYNEERRMITQFILDCNQRCIIQRVYHPFGHTEIINAVRLMKPKHIIIFTENRTLWQTAARAFFLNNVIIKHPFRMTSDEIDQYRSGVLIIDVDHRETAYKMHGYRIQNFASEFQQTIIYDSWTASHYPWPLLAKLLFPTMPSPLYVRTTADIPNMWITKPISYFAPYFNMCLFPEFIKAKDMKLLSDETLLSNLQACSNNLL